MIILAIWIIFSFWYSPKNEYIKKHKAKNKNDSDYKDYLKWCLDNGEIPADKISFIKEVEDKENNIKKIL